MAAAVVLDRVARDDQRDMVLASEALRATRPARARAAAGEYQNAENETGQGSHRGDRIRGARGVG